MRDDKIKIIIRGIILVNISEIICHLGKNPIKGGRPPIDHNLKRIFILSGVLLEKFNWEREFTLNWLKIRNKIAETTEYKVIYTSHDGVFERTDTIIQQMWLMEEYDISFFKDNWDHKPKNLTRQDMIVIQKIKFCSLM